MSGVNEEYDAVGIKVDTVLLSQVHTVSNPLDLALLSLKERIQSPIQHDTVHNIMARAVMSSQIVPQWIQILQSILLKCVQNFLVIMGRTQN